MLDAATHVIALDLAMPVHADEDIAARPRNGGVQRRRRDSAVIIKEMTAMRAGSHRFDNFSRAVGGQPGNG